MESKLLQCADCGARECPENVLHASTVNPVNPYWEYRCEVCIAEMAQYGPMKVNKTLDSAVIIG